MVKNSLGQKSQGKQKQTLGFPHLHSYLFQHLGPALVQGPPHLYVYLHSASADASLRSSYLRGDPNVTGHICSFTPLLTAAVQVQVVQIHPVNFGDSLYDSLLVYE